MESPLTTHLNLQSQPDTQGTFAKIDALKLQFPTASPCRFLPPQHNHPPLGDKGRGKRDPYRDPTSHIPGKEKPTLFPFFPIKLVPRDAVMEVF